ncbi:MAG: hypothetical protein PWQ25_1174 [Deferribacteres bacterium]|jgi:hypothetical protein|nr:hypothetical protein [Deferribacteres bacterium]
MRMMLGLVLLGFLLLGSSFYFGIKYFDGKVEEKPYEEASLYDMKREIVEKNHLSLEILNIEKLDNKYKICFTINGNIERPFPIEGVEILRPAGKDVIRPDIRVREKICSVNVPLSQGYYILKVFLRMKEIVSLEKTISIK